VTWSGVSIKRPTLIVRDLDQALAIYRDVLGFSMGFVKDMQADSYSRPVFRIPDHAQGRFCTLNAGPDQPNALALIEVTGVELPKPAHRPFMSTIVVHVPNDFDGVLAKLAAMPGVSMVPEAVLKTQDGRLGREAAFIDPDGHLVVLYQITGMV
jgi:catechol 2,3-dioxygenase-like lactoylglutathione lyase family enzyme